MGGGSRPWRLDFGNPGWNLPLKTCPASSLGNGGRILQSLFRGKWLKVGRCRDLGVNLLST